MLSIDEVKRAMPAHMKTQITPELVERLNRINDDPEFARAVQGNFVTYTSAGLQGQFSAEQYMNAVTFVTYRLMGLSNNDAYEQTFPERYERLLEGGAGKKKISAYVSGFSKSKLVTLLTEQAMVPTWLVNQDNYQQAINTQVELMLGAKSEKVRSDAANSILTHLKPPEVRKTEISISQNQSSAAQNLAERLMEVAHQQQASIQQGVPTKNIAHQSLVQVPVEDAEIVEAPQK
jgi:hypothetical protein